MGELRLCWQISVREQTKMKETVTAEERKGASLPQISVKRLEPWEKMAVTLNPDFSVPF